MKEIPLTRGYVALVDDEDYERISGHKWCSNIHPRKDGTNRVYAVRDASTEGRIHRVYLHRAILEYNDRNDIDHIDGNPLNNVRSNLRVCSRAENARNARVRTGGTSRFKGVRWHSQNKNWQARITVNGKDRHIGIFGSEVDAAVAYDVAAKVFFGCFAKLNFKHMEPRP